MLTAEAVVVEEEKPSEPWGPEYVGAELIVNGPPPTFSGPIAFDIETNGGDVFVGIALADASLPKRVYYYTHLGPIQEVLEIGCLIAHNGKGDLTWLRKWGVDVNEQNLFFDTMLASYVINPTRESHGLKPLAQTLLGWLWPSYTEITSSLVNGRRKRGLTLDKLPVPLVSRYCGMDCLATLALYERFMRTMTTEQRRMLFGLEMPVNRLLFKMEQRGVQINLNLLSDLDKEFAQKITEILIAIKELTAVEIEKLLVTYRLEQLKEKWEQSGYKAFEKTKELNPGSWQQKRLLLKFLGFIIESTDKKELIKFRDKHKIINLLLQHSEFSKLYNTFIKGFQELTTLPVVHTTYNQVSEDSSDEDYMRGLKTGRLSSKNPNLQQIPTRTENGQKLRALFIPAEGHTLIVADYSQIELRIAAHYSHDPILCKAFKEGEDVHEATAKALGVDRFSGKTANFLLAFGGWHKKLMTALNIDEKQAKDFYNAYWSKFWGLKLWKQKAIDKARVQGGVRTLYGRWIPVDGLNLPNPYQRAARERFVISGIVQGSASDVIKLAMLELDKNGHDQMLTTHDEVVCESDLINVDEEEKAVKWTMENIVKLDIPLEVTIGHGASWGEAKA